MFGKFEEDILAPKKIVKSVFIVIFVSAICKLAGFLRETVIAAYFGAGIAADAYFIAQTTSNAILTVIETALGAVFLPAYVRYSTMAAREDTDKFASNAFNGAFLISLAISAAGMVMAPFIVKVVAPGFGRKALDLAADLTRITLGVIVFISLSVMVSGILQTKGHFVMPAFISMPMNIAVIMGTVLFSGRCGVYALAWASITGAALQVLMQLPLLKGKFRYRFVLDFKRHGIPKLGLSMLPVIVGTALNQINSLISRMLASGLGAGSVSAINYSEILTGFMTGVFTTAVAVVVYPLFSELSVRQDFSEYGKILSRVTVAIAAVIMPAAAGMILLRQDIVRIVFERGAFDVAATGSTSYVMGFSALGMIGFGLKELLVKAFYSLNETKKPNIVMIISTGTGIILSAVMVRWMGIGGLGLATAVSGLLCAALLFCSFTRLLGEFDYKGMTIEITKVLGATILMSMFVYFLKHVPDWNGTNLSICVSIPVGAVLYALLLYLLAFKELHSAARILKAALIPPKDSGLGT